MRQRRDGGGTDDEVIGTVEGVLTGAAANALRKVCLRVLDLAAAIKGACW